MLPDLIPPYGQRRRSCFWNFTDEEMVTQEFGTSGQVAVSGRRRESNPGLAYLRVCVLSKCLSVGRGLERCGFGRTDGSEAHLNLGGLAARMFILPSRPSPLGAPPVLTVYLRALAMGAWFWPEWR